MAWAEIGADDKAAPEKNVGNCHLFDDTFTPQQLFAFAKERVQCPGLMSRSNVQIQCPDEWADLMTVRWGGSQSVTLGKRVRARNSTNRTSAPFVLYPLTRPRIPDPRP